MSDSYELFYGGGGHAGPYHGLEEAKRCAMNYLLGCHTAWIVYIRPRVADLWKCPEAVPAAAIARKNRETGEVSFV
jgi:hypothetical protein